MEQLQRIARGDYRQMSVASNVWYRHVQATHQPSGVGRSWGRQPSTTMLGCGTRCAALIPGSLMFFLRQKSPVLGGLDRCFGDLSPPVEANWRSKPPGSKPGRKLNVADRTPKSCAKLKGKPPANLELFDPASFCRSSAELHLCGFLGMVVAQICVCLGSHGIPPSLGVVCIHGFCWGCIGHPSARSQSFAWLDSHVAVPPNDK